jgi:osmotically-inducible protein OsmY
MVTNTSLADAVIASLELDSRIPDSLEIAVCSDDGVVTLTGSVGSCNQLLAAVEDANSVEGVVEVDNQVTVDLNGPHRRADEEIRGVPLREPRRPESSQ